MIRYNTLRTTYVIYPCNYSSHIYFLPQFHCYTVERDLLRIESGDRVRALKFITKARRLDPSLAIDNLLWKLEDQLSNKPTNESSSSSSSSDPVAYTEEHISIVREIKGKKRTEGTTVISPPRRAPRDHGRGTPCPSHIRLWMDLERGQRRY